MVARSCDSCRSAAANLYCSADLAFLCIACDSRVHAANKLACRHSRVWLCEVCEQSPAAVTCKADAASLCAACDLHVHSANPLARRHDRLPVSPFFDPPSPAAAAAEEEAEAATWILPDPKPAESPDLNSLQCGLEMDPYLDLEYGPVDTKLELYDGAAADGVVPAQGHNGSTMALINEVGPPDNYFEFDFGGSKPFTYSFNSQSLSHSVSSPSMEVGVVPDASVTADAPDPFSGKANPYVESTNPTAQVTGADREARVLRYREKRKNRKFEKTIRYASRKAYAETRPRIKGRFAKREIESISDVGYGVVPSF